RRTPRCWERCDASSPVSARSSETDTLLDAESTSSTRTRTGWASPLNRLALTSYSGCRAPENASTALTAVPQPAFVSPLVSVGDDDFINSSYHHPQTPLKRRQPRCPLT